MAKLILWAPRVLAFFIFVFLIVMSYGLFSQGTFTGEQRTAFLVSLCPALILLAGLITGWKRKIAGGIIIMILGTIMTFLFRKYGDLIAFLPLATPVLVTGILFILSSFYEKALLQNKGNQ